MAFRQNPPRDPYYDEDSYERRIGAGPGRVDRFERVEERFRATRPVGTSDALDWLRSALGVLGLFVAFAVAVALLAFSAAYALKGVNLSDPNQVAALGAASLVAILPLVGGPILSAMGGFWAGTRTRDGGQGALGGALGALLGVIALALLTAIGFAIGANAASVNLANVAWPAGLYLRPGWTTTVGYFGTSAGLLYLVACLLAAGIAGAIAGALYAPFEERGAGYATRREYGYGRMPRI